MEKYHYKLWDALDALDSTTNHAHVQPECGQMYGYLTNESKSEALILARERLTELKEKKYFSRTGK